MNVYVGTLLRGSLAANEQYCRPEWFTKSTEYHTRYRGPTTPSDQRISTPPPSDTVSIHKISSFNDRHLVRLASPVYDWPGVRGKGASL